MSIAKHQWIPHWDDDVGGVVCGYAEGRINPMKRHDADCVDCGAEIQDPFAGELTEYEDMDEVYHFYEKSKGE